MSNPLFGFSKHSVVFKCKTDQDILMILSLVTLVSSANCLRCCNAISLLCYDLSLTNCITIISYDCTFVKIQEPFFLLMRASKSSALVSVVTVLAIAANNLYEWFC